MPMRSTRHLSEPRREAMLRELKTLKELEEQVKRQAEMDRKVHIAMCVAEGVTLREIAEVFGVSATAVGNWRADGDRERERLRKEQGHTDS